MLIVGRRRDTSLHLAQGVRRRGERALLRTRSTAWHRPTSRQAAGALTAGLRAAAGFATSVGTLGDRREELVTRSDFNGLVGQRVRGAKGRAVRRALSGA